MPTVQVYGEHNSLSEGRTLRCTTCEEDAYDRYVLAGSRREVKGLMTKAGMCAACLASELEDTGADISIVEQEQ